MLVWILSHQRKYCYYLYKDGKILATSHFYRLHGGINILLFVCAKQVQLIYTMKFKMLHNIIYI